MIASWGFTLNAFDLGGTGRLVPAHLASNPDHLNLAAYGAWNRIWPRLAAPSKNGQFKLSLPAVTGHIKEFTRK